MGAWAAVVAGFKALAEATGILRWWLERKDKIAEQKAALAQKNLDAMRQNHEIDQQTEHTSADDDADVLRRLRGQEQRPDEPKT